MLRQILWRVPKARESASIAFPFDVRWMRKHFVKASETEGGGNKKRKNRIAFVAGVQDFVDACSCQRTCFRVVLFWTGGTGRMETVDIPGSPASPARGPTQYLDHFRIHNALAALPRPPLTWAIQRRLKTTRVSWTKRLLVVQWLGGRG